MRGFSLYSAVLALTASSIVSVPAGAAEPVVLEPSSNWNLDYADDKCRLIRFFGEGDSKVEFQLEQSGLEPFYTLAFFGKPVRARHKTVMRIKFGPSEGTSERSFISGKAGDAKIPFVVMHGIHLDAPPKNAKQGEFLVVDIGPEREAAISDVSFTRGLRKPVTLQLGPMGAPFDAMRTCVRDLLNKFGEAKADTSRLSQGTKPLNQKDVARYLAERYPQEMLRENKGGTVGVRLTINQKGKVSACQITKSERPLAFDDHVCFGLMKIAKFEPALGPDGEPRLGTYTTAVVYRLN